MNSVQRPSRSANDDDRANAAFANALTQALEGRPKTLSPKWLYDAAGSALFERICTLPEYYPTRTETAMLQARASEIAATLGPNIDLIEFGAGALDKVRLLLEGGLNVQRFVPIDISAEHLLAAVDALKRDWPALEVQPLVADLTAPLRLPPVPANARVRAGFFPGSSIGNFTPDEALAFLRRVASALRAERGVAAGLLIGVDLVKDPAVLHAAYNDAEGVTAAFNRNVLVRANRELGTNFDPEAFDHYAPYRVDLQRIEMHLVSRTRQTVRMGGREFVFAAGESLHTESSHKYTVASFRALADAAGFARGPVWCDPAQQFSLHWLPLPPG